ncbi:glutathione S-transferase family protein [Flexibacterium corallicola]|uniref:glutathione S-transferase family protein n=1 Tax=Flexibacterium corallicola TaxID=3037259 RepID=UPI00286F0D93|nr:glutathione S-transferase N-terminal domain-containing protein [Pseudovibrio sp. M1P-2-3]
MIDFYTWSTPNGLKVSILLEELGVPYKVHPINLEKNEKLHSKFLQATPFKKVPAIFDNETGVGLFESGAILLYLADKNKKFLPSELTGYWQTVQWLMWQMAGLGPIAGQAHHFVKIKPDKSQYATNHYVAAVKNLYGILDRHMENKDYINEEYTIADISCWPWVSRFEWQNVDLKNFPNVRRWYNHMATRPAVQRAYQIPIPMGGIPVG